MKRLIIAVVTASAIFLGTAGLASPIHLPELGCHSVYITPPGWTQPVRVTLCP